MNSQIARVRPEEILAFTAAVLERCGVEAGDADAVATVLVDANLRGVDTHGVALLPLYARRLRSGAIAARPNIQVVRETASFALLGGGNGLGQLVSVRAMRLALRKAGETGAAIVGVRNSNHFGAAAHYAVMAANDRKIGLAMTVGAGNCMAPWGGVDNLLSNNPLAIAVPAGEEAPPVLDMATSVVARGKVIAAAKEGHPISPGWALDAAGQPTTDPQAALEGLLVPIGGYKGYGLTVMIGLLAGALTGAALDRQVRPFLDETVAPANGGHLFGAIDVGAAGPVEEFCARVDAHVRTIRESRRAPEVERIYVPGEIEHLTARERRANGIPLGPSSVQELDRLAVELDVRAPFAARDGGTG